MCSICKKKILLTECKCLKKFCIGHLQPESHNCCKLDEFRKEAFEKNKNKLMKQAVIEKKIEII